MQEKTVFKEDSNCYFHSHKKNEQEKLDSTSKIAKDIKTNAL